MINETPTPTNPGTMTMVELEAALTGATTDYSRGVLTREIKGRKGTTPGGFKIPTPRE